MEISREEYITILKEKDKYEKMKDNLRSENEKYKRLKYSKTEVKTFLSIWWVMFKCNEFINNTCK